MAETLNFREASERLHLSTPALSKQVKDLETELGVRLLDRNTVHVQLTNAGEVFLAEARQILAQAERAMRQAREVAKGQRGRLAVGNIGPLTASYMAACLTAFCARYPEVEVELIDIELSGQVQALDKRTIHVGFVPAGAVADLPAGFHHVSVLRTPLGVVASNRHPFAAERSISFAQLAREKLLCITGGTARNTHRTYLESLLAKRGLKPARVAEVKGFESLLAMVAGRQGVSVIAGRPGLLHVEGIVMRPFREAGDDTVLDVHAVWRPEAVGPLAENFVNEFRRVSHAKLETAELTGASTTKRSRKTT